jgi:hypothetical protein
MAPNTEIAANTEPALNIYMVPNMDMAPNRVASRLVHHPAVGACQTPSLAVFQILKARLD